MDSYCILLTHPPCRPDFSLDMLVSVPKAGETAGTGALAITTVTYGGGGPWLGGAGEASASAAQSPLEY